jgi:hypothetical protein
MKFRQAALIGSVAGFGLIFTGSAAVADPPPSPQANLETDWANVYAKRNNVRSSNPPSASTAAKPASAGNNAKKPAYEYRLTLACGSNRVRSVEGSSDVTNCAEALIACRYRTPPSETPLYLVWRRATDPANSPWELVGDMCGTEAAPEAAAPRPVPTMAQIQEAFRRLPFSKPTVRIEPKGNVTLVNLPTYYEATWPGDSGLQPGEVSQPVKLLSWSVEFKIDSHSYNFHYGDGSSSGTVEDAGGGYPDGSVKHTYTAPIEAAPVRVDSRLTGQFRVNGGDWVDIDTIADLQDEPVTTLEVREAKARLYTN